MIFVKYDFKGPCYAVKSNHMVTQTSKLLMLVHLKAPKLLWQMRYPVQNQYEGLTESVGGLNSDPIFSITHVVTNYAENGQERFIWSYTNDDGPPKIIAFTDDQIDDLVDFCCNDRE